MQIVSLILFLQGFNYQILVKKHHHTLNILEATKFRVSFHNHNDVRFVILIDTYTYIIRSYKQLL